ncbi:hypothetical protein FRX31_034725, partial [Thalictrum thalictroides]
MYLEKDLVVWTPTSSGEFNTKSAYRALNPILNKVVWHNLVLGKFVIPKHSFTCWQLFSGSIQTADRLRQKGIPAANGCVLCDTRSPHWEWWSILKLCRGKDMKSEILKVFVSAVVSLIWTERNRRIHQNKSMTAEILKGNLLRDMVMYLQVQLEEVKYTQEVKDLLNRIGVSPNYIPRNIITCFLQSPEEGTILINYDGAVSATRSGYGGILRNSQGETLLACNGGTSSSSVLIQELDAIGQGLLGVELINGPFDTIMEKYLRILAMNGDLDRQQLLIPVMCESPKQAPGAWPLQREYIYNKQLVGGGLRWHLRVDHCQ